MTDFTYFTCQPNANTIELSSFKIRPVFSCWSSRWCSWQRAGGGYPDGSSPIPPPLLWPGWWFRPDVIWFWNTRAHSARSNGTKIQNVILLLLPAYPTSKPRHKAGSCKNTFNPPPLLCLIQRKASTDLRQCLKVRDGRQRNKARRKSVQNVRKSTWQLHKDDFCHLWQKVSPPVVSGSQLSDTGMWAICQISNLNIYLKGLTKLHLSPACSLHVTEEDCKRD